MEVSLAKCLELLHAANNIAITAHLHPDGDSLGSMLALYHYLVAQGKQPMLVLDDKISPALNFLPGSDAITTNCDQPIDSDLLVVLDASDIERIGKISTLIKAPILNIDHHISNTKYADYFYIDSTAAATGEIIFQALQAAGATITSDMAVCLYTAIATDCGFFRYANTSPKTMRYGAYLMELGVKPNLIAETLETVPLSNIKLLTDVLETLQVHDDGKIAVITVDARSLDPAESTEGFINYPRNLEGVDIAMLFKIVDDHTIRVSMRSRQADVSKLALQFGGGGHARAAGCTVDGTIDSAAQQVITAAITLLQEG